MSFSRLRKKKSKTYIYTAIDRETKNIVSYHVDNERSIKALDVLLDKIKDLKVESVHTDKCFIYNNLSYKYDKHNPS